MIRPRFFVVCPEERKGPYTLRRARELRDKWNDLNVIRDPDTGEVLSTGCNPHRVRVRLGRGKARDRR